MKQTDSEIIEILKDYIDDNRYNQAILIDGEWGSGKTFFIQEKLIPILNEDENLFVCYISLYGIDSLDKISDQIETEVLKFNYFKKNKIEFQGKLGLIPSILCDSVSNLIQEKTGIDIVLKLREFLDFENTVIIFDDIERSLIHINELLGYINNMVEHNKIKAILVANENEIGKMNFNQNIEAKYNIALNKNIKAEYNSKKIEEMITIDELNEKTEAIFFTNTLYKRIKEKLIGLTIFYNPEISQIFDQIKNKYIKKQEVKSLLDKYKDIILRLFKIKKHSNLRTLIFIMIRYEKIYEKLSNISFKNSKFLNSEYEKILLSVVDTSIKLKNGEILYQWNENERYLERFDNAIFAIKHGFHLPMYRFVDDYLLKWCLNNEEMRVTIQNQLDLCYLKEIKQGISIYKLKEWWFLEDSEVDEYLSKLLTELTAKERIYDCSNIDTIINFIARLEIENLITGEIKNDILESIKKMIEDLDEDSEEFNSLKRFTIKNDNEVYNKIVMPLIEIQEKKINQKNKKNLDLNALWGDKFRRTCFERGNLYSSNKKFLYYIDLDSFKTSLENSNTEDIYLFNYGIQAVYDFSNLYDYYKSDIEKITDMLKIIRYEKNKELNNKTKTIALNTLEEYLTKILEILNNN